MKLLTSPRAHRAWLRDELGYLDPVSVPLPCYAYWTIPLRDGARVVHYLTPEQLIKMVVDLYNASEVRHDNR